MTFTRVVHDVPLSDWLTAGIAIVLAILAAARLRKGGSQGGRLLGVLALAAGAALFATSGQRIISEAIAGADPPEINLTISPGVGETLKVNQSCTVRLIADPT